LLEINTSEEVRSFEGTARKFVRDNENRGKGQIPGDRRTPEGCSVELTKDQGPWKTTIDAAGVVETRRGESEVERSFRGAVEAASII
jgi:hypothetical protein